MNLDLEGGPRWDLAAGDGSGSSLLRDLASVLGSAKDDPGTAEPALRRRLRVSFVGDSLNVEAGSAGERFSFASQNFAAARRWSGYEGEDRVLHLIALSLVLAEQLQGGGGALLHGALAERNGVAALLLGPSGRGKSTASRLLTPPWRSLSDDLALLVPGEPGEPERWRAHAWPTWSALRKGGAGGSWDVRRGVDARGIFFLQRAPGGAAVRVGPGRAACLLMESFEQAWWAGTALFPPERFAAIRRQAFENISSLVKAVPAFLLPMASSGPFWEKIEEALGAVCCTA
jgi:hypothetical protein